MDISTSLHPVNGRRRRSVISVRLRCVASLCAGEDAEDRTDDRDPSTVSLLLSQLRRDHSHSRRQRLERHSAGGPRRRRSGSSNQSRHALSERRIARAGNPESAPPSQTTGPTPRNPITGKTSCGSRRSTKSAADRRPRATHVRRKGRRGRIVNRCEGIAWNGGCTDTNEFNYLVVKTMRSLGRVRAPPPTLRCEVFPAAPAVSATRGPSGWRSRSEDPNR